MEDLEELYISRSYCRDIKCNIQTMLDNTDPVNELTRNSCKFRCAQCEAYKFHHWLKDNNYKIVKVFKEDV